MAKDSHAPSVFIKAFVCLSPVAIMAGGFSAFIGYSFVDSFSEDKLQPVQLLTIMVVSGFILLGWCIRIWICNLDEKGFWITALVFHTILIPMPLAVINESDFIMLINPVSWPLLGLATLGIVLSLLSLMKTEASDQPHVPMIDVTGKTDSDESSMAGVDTIIWNGMPFDEAMELLGKYFVVEGTRPYTHPTFRECEEFTFSMRSSSSSILRIYVIDGTIRGFE